MMRHRGLPLKRFFLASGALALFAATAYAEPPRAKFVYTKKLGGVLVKDGTAYPVGSFWGKELLEIFPEGTGEAHRLAKESVRKKGLAGKLKITGIILMAGFFPSMAQNNDLGRWIGLGVMAGGIGCTIGARVQRDHAFAYFFRAINAYNEDPALGALGSPGGNPSMERQGLSLRFAVRF